MRVCCSSSACGTRSSMTIFTSKTMPRAARRISTSPPDFAFYNEPPPASGAGELYADGGAGLASAVIARHG